jgi:hypothetical protein
LVYYGIGIIINITLHKDCRLAILTKPFIDKLTEVFGNYYLEDFDLSKVAIKALLNLTSENSYWSEEQIKSLDDVLLRAGEELDEIMPEANETELVEITNYR